MARSFPGTASNYLAIADGSSFDVTGQTDFSVSIWAKATVIDATVRCVMGKYLTGTNNRSWEFNWDNSGLKFTTNADGTSATNTTVVGPVLQAGRWYHICGVQNSVDSRLYVDGKLESLSTPARSLFNSSAPTRFGQRGDNTTFWDGQLSQVSVWSRPLDPTEVMKLARGMSPLLLPGTRHLKGYFPFDTYNARDFSIYNNTPALTGTVLFTADPEAILFDLSSMLVPVGLAATATYTDTATVYLDLQASGSDIYEPGCFIIGDGEAQLRWSAGDQYLRWLGYDANLRWDANVRIGTAHC